MEFRILGPLGWFQRAVWSSCSGSMSRRIGWQRPAGHRFTTPQASGEGPHSGHAHQKLVSQGHPHLYRQTASKKDHAGW